MKTSKKEYSRMVEKASPPSRLVKNCTWAFMTGGSICALGEWLYRFYMNMGFIISDARLMSSITLVGLSALFTGLGWYSRLAKRAGSRRERARWCP